MAFPLQLRVKEIDRKGEDWARYHYAWDLMNWLYVGGVEIQAVADQFLKRRPKELSDVFQSRVETFTYQNHAGSAIDWYQAALFERPVQVTPVEGSTLNKETTDFFDRLSENCDRNYTPLQEHQRVFFRNLLLFGRAATLVDLPPQGEYKSLAEQKAAGQFEPYLVQLDPRLIISYSRAPHGPLNWIKYSCRVTEEGNGFEEPKILDQWYYYDRQNFAVYERVVPADEKNTPDDAVVNLKASGPHALSDIQEVPVIYTELPEGLWLMNRAFLVAQDHLNNDNVLKFALKMSALCMPVIESDGEVNIALSEAGYIKLQKGDKYYWTEPNGQSFSHLSERNQTLVQEIYRMFYLVAQGRSVNATAAAASGISKQQDMAPSKKVMNLFGDVMRSKYQRLYNMLSAAHGDNNLWDARGLEFPEDPPDAELETISMAMVIDAPSKKFQDELYKKAVRAALPDANRKLLDEISAEIEAAPDKATREAQNLAQTGQALVTSRALSTDFPRGSV